MGTGYIRQDVSNSIANGEIIDADDLNDEFDAIEAAFTAATGHSHDGTASEGGAVSVLGPAQDIVATGTDLAPKSDNTYDLGTSTNEWKDLYVDGVAYLDTVDVDAGNIDGTVVGATTPAAGNFTDLTSDTLLVNATSSHIGLADFSGGITVAGTAGFANSLTVAGTTTLGATTIASGTFTAFSTSNADINGGAIDGTPVGASSSSTGRFTTLHATSAITGDSSLTVTSNIVGANIYTTGAAAAMTGDTISANYLNCNTNLSVGNQVATKFLTMNASGGYYTLAVNGEVSGQMDVTGSIIKSGQSYWHPTNDGAGSGLDADLLDGQQGSYYTDITARLGFNPVQNGTGVGQTSNIVKIGWDGGAGIKATVDATDFNFLARSFSSSTVMGEVGATGTGSVGTVGMFRVVPGQTVSPGVIVSGAILRYSNCEGTDSGIAPSGQWRCMGYAIGNNPQTATTIYVRVS